MDQLFDDYLNSKIEETIGSLRKTNGEYALAVEKGSQLLKSISPIIRQGKDITISAGDCADINDYLEQEFIQIVVMQQELYRQGYLDCVKLLRTLGVLL